MRCFKVHIIFFCVAIFLGQSSCVEEIPIDTTQSQDEINIEEILVVEATLTNEFIQQKILLSRASSFANDSLVIYEKNASVSVIDDLGSLFSFENTINGQYQSSEAFAAQNGRGYKLLISTSKGEEFESEFVASAGVSTIDNIYAERIINDNQIDGMAIFVDSSNPSEDFNNYRYTYEETYKIIAPNWTSSEFEIIQEYEEIRDENTGELLEVTLPDVKLVPRMQKEQICYNSVPSNSIILSDGLLLNESRIDKNQIRFINRNNSILSHRYSILVKQFLQSPDAANFYNTLLRYSQNESFFSEIQPGLLEGNIKSIGDSQKIVLGYFEVASVAEKRLFFNYNDFFPDEALPPYFNGLNCNEAFSPRLVNYFREPIMGVLLSAPRDGPWDPFECGIPRQLVSYIKAEDIEFFLSNSNPPPLCEGPYLVTQRACGDCTVLGSNVKPDYWID